MKRISDKHITCICWLTVSLAIFIFSSCSDGGGDDVETSGSKPPVPAITSDYIGEWETSSTYGYCSDIADTLFLSIKINSNGTFSGIYDTYVIGYSIQIAGFPYYVCRLLEKPKSVSGWIDYQKKEGYMECEGLGGKSFTVTKSETTIRFNYPASWTWKQSIVTRKSV